WYLEVLRKYAVFRGRARRKEYWYFFLFNVINSVVLAFVDGVTGSYNAVTGVGILGSLYSLAMFVPSLAVSVRRLHDTCRSGWWLLIALIPLLGTIVFFFFMVLDSFPGENQYGPNPKEQWQGLA
ncbi:MAG: DUF805 domain-containing protein, partial [Desulfobulbaceae bacterium]|nr:DUF805 domain-containing protein [Desulfobulbaceae bacterium]